MPAEDASRFRKGVDLLKKGQLEEAIHELEIAATTGEDLPLEHFALAVAYAKAGEEEAAVVEFQRFLSMSPDDPKRITYAKERIARLEASIHRSPAQEATRQLDASTAQLTTTAKAAAEPVDAALESAASTLAAGHAEQACELFQRATARDPRSWRARNGLGKAVFQYALRQAFAHFEQAAALDPHATEPLFNMGTMALLMGDAERARACFQAVLERDPADAEVRGQLEGMPRG